MLSLRIFWAVAALAWSAMAGLEAAAQPGPARDTLPAYEIPRSEIRTLTSQTLGRTYSLYIKLPPGYGRDANGDKTYPVIYLNDAAYCFQTAAGITHMPMNLGGLEHAILVGISYAHGESGFESRSRDLTPTDLGPGAKYTHGGARAYLTFLKDEVLPFVEETYRADPAERTLVGQSYGGLFGAYALVTEPGLFSGYILTSPSLWFDGHVMFDLAKAAGDRPLKGRVYFATGATETPENHGGKNDLAADQTRFAALLRAQGHDGLEVQDRVVPGATHQTTFPIGLTRGLMWLHEGPDRYNGGARWYGR